MTNIVSVIQKRARNVTEAKKDAYFFLKKDLKIKRLTLAQLDLNARHIASYLQKQRLNDKRIIVLFPEGFEFVTTFIACLYARSIAVPMSLSQHAGFKENLNFIAKDADVAAIIVPHKDYAQVKKNLTCDIPIIDYNDIIENESTHFSEYFVPEITQNTIVYLQYTSGSTSLPKAAVITHHHLIHSLKNTAQAWCYDKKSRTLIWAPHTHVYGLVCGLLLPLYHGTPAIIMPTRDFIEKPINWLKAISAHHVTHSGCPNFGYELCLKHIDESELSHLDLNHWHFAINGGEKVNEETLKKFARKFKSCGFDIKHFNSAYGMSEAAGAIAVHPSFTAPIEIKVEKKALKNNDIVVTDDPDSQTFITNGTVLPHLKVIIVDPETKAVLPQNKIGEIWLQGKSIISGYWRRQDDDKTFKGEVKNKKNDYYFRTHDLGFMHDDLLCVTGRSSDIIVLNGSKYNATDLENTITKNDNIEKCIIFSTDSNNSEKLIVMCEIQNHVDQQTQEKVIEIIREDLLKKHGVLPHHVLLVASNTLARTSSGKLKRHNIIEDYIAECDARVSGDLLWMDPRLRGDDKKRRGDDTFVTIISDILHIQPSDIDLSAPVSRYHFDSIHLIQLTGKLNEHYDLTLTPADCYDVTTLGALYDKYIRTHVKHPREDDIESHSVKQPKTIQDIAIIGMSGLFPDAQNIEEFWQNLINGRDVIRDIPKDRWDWEVFYGDPKNEHNKTNIKWGGFIRDAYHFDASFFNISPHEARLMDPQQRLFLMTVWHAIENASMSIKQLSKLKTGLYVGVLNHDYAELIHQQHLYDAYMTTGLSESMIANRVSYLLDLHGPSETIDTACSSSLVAIHHACQAIHHGDCDIAIAGAVNMLLTPTSYITASKANMLSLDGRCHTFDSDANGYVRSEGIAAIVLKPLEQAIKDEDHIYAVIKASAVNHAGHTHSLTAPNPTAQRDVIIDAMTRAHVTSVDIDFIETHGTGTPLGDPIEIDGLKHAFNHLLENKNKTMTKENYCGLTAVKTHVGHLEAAAGMAGLIKVVLALQHEMMPKNLHFKTLNPYIKLDHTPFYIVDKKRLWLKKENKRRRAGISSFGFGGTNAHVIIEEAPEREHKHLSVEPTACLIVLSAKTELSLYEKAKNLHEWLRHHQTVDLNQLSYTLLLGRDHFENRCAMIVNSVLDLLILLEEIKPGKLNTICLDSENKTLSTTAEDYLSGRSIDVTKLNFVSKKRVIVPCYPFEKTEFKIDATSHPHTASPRGNDTAKQQKTFSKYDNYVRDHVIQGKMMLPGAALLNMVMPGPMTLNDIIFYQPVIIENEITTIDLELIPKNHDTTFHIRHSDTLVAEGVMKNTAKKESASDHAEVLSKALPHSLSQKEFYNLFEQCGMNYGDHFKRVQHIAYDENRAYAKLSLPAHSKDNNQICLLDAIMHAVFVLVENKQSCVPLSIAALTLHESLPETCFALITKIKHEQLPSFNIDVFDEKNNLVLMIKKLSLYYYEEANKNDIYYYQPEWTRVDTIVSNSLANKTCLLFAYDHPQNYYSELPGKIVWVEAGHAFEIKNDHHYVINMTKEEDYYQLIEHCIEKNTVPDYYFISHVREQLNSDVITTAKNDLIVSFNFVKQILKKSFKQKIHVVSLLDQTMLGQHALSAFYKTIVLENPKIVPHVISMNKKSYSLRDFNPSFFEMSYDEEQNCYTHNVREITCEKKITRLKKNGVYLITGGLGKIGFALATFLASQYQATLVLTGRSKPTTQQSDAIKKLSERCHIIYIPADVAKQNDVDGLIAETLKQFNHLDGIIHAAGVTHDQFIILKSISEINEVLKPKINGAYYLDQATKDLNLDFFVSFSSVASVFGNAGQCDYAYANGWLDDFADHRQQLVKKKMRRGQTISINWPLWQDGGITLHDDVIQTLREQLGIVPLATHEGVAAFHDIVQSNVTQVIVLPGDKKKLAATLMSSQTSLRANAFGERGNPETETGSPRLNATQLTRDEITNVSELTSDVVMHHDNHDDFISSVTTYLREFLAHELSMPAEKIILNQDFGSYGIDSLMIINLNHKLEKNFAGLPKTLFFEYKTLAALRDYFLEHQGERLHSFCHSRELDCHASDPHCHPRAGGDPYMIDPRLRGDDSGGRSHDTVRQGDDTVRDAGMTQGNNTEHPNNDIAIIGIAGTYPKANDVHAFWRNLFAGTNCISEIPKERFLHEQFNHKSGGFIDHVDQFDPLFFNISPKEAAQMDPQERLFLQTSWQVIEDAGYNADDLINKQIGVFVGVMYGHYQLFSATEQNAPLTHSFYASIANRVSYFFNFHGPSVALDTMCSSSLTAIHFACQSLQRGESELALVGGVNLSLHPYKYALLSQGKFLSSTGQCISFGEGGDGYVPGEGIGAVLLKPLAHALRDHDHIYGVIKGSSLNHGGRTNHYTVPNPKAQAEVIADAYRRAAIDPATISYVEAHGTGTALGDPIEIASLSHAFSQSSHMIPIGSVKSNIGHCEGAAGIAALTKVLMQMKFKTYVPSLNATELNKNIDWDKCKFKVQQKAENWPVPQGVSHRRAGINSFGAGGSNAHLIVEEYQSENEKNQMSIKPFYLCILSAKNKESLQQNIRKLLTWLNENEDEHILRDISYTLNVGRKHFNYRCIICASSLDELKNSLNDVVNEQNHHAYLMNQNEIELHDDDANVQTVIENILTDCARHITPDDYRKNLMALAQLSLDGHKIDWKKLYQDEHVYRVVLPHYSFLRERIWFDSFSKEVRENDKGVSRDNSVIHDMDLDSVENSISEIICTELKLTATQFDMSKNVSEYGIDSVSFITIMTKINALYHLDLSPAIFYAYPSVMQLSTHLVDQYSNVVRGDDKEVHDDNSVEHQEHDIAIIGMQGIFPGSEDTARFYDNLIAEKDLIRPCPEDRDWHHETIRGGFIERVADFDAAFFNISSREANLMDPQQRLFLEIAWKTIEDAGYNPESMTGHAIGVFVGAEFNEYHGLIATANEPQHGFIATGNSHSMIANRVSYYLNLHGPSETIDTACSSSLVALHRACQAILNHDCHLALAGGVSLNLDVNTTKITDKLGALSQDGCCKTFDKSANGYVKGEGVAALLLKPLKQAIKDGDHIYAVIKATAVNHGGKAQSFTAPNAAAQAELLMSAYQKAALLPEELQYIETHGTGTALGDPVEIEGLKIAFKKIFPNLNEKKIGLGALKTNIGHLEPASGIASVIKVLLSLKNHAIPRNIHFNELNPYIKLEASPFYLLNETKEWPRTTVKRAAGVSSFGFGGTNAHVVLQEGEERTSIHPKKPYYLLTLSAKSENGLQQKIKDLLQWLKTQREDINIEALSYTLNTGRAHFNYRCAFIAKDYQYAITVLENFFHAGEQNQVLLSDVNVKVKGPVFDEMYRAAMHDLKNNQNIEKLFIIADLYTKYYAIDWQMLHDNEAHQRLSGLPIYPFNKIKHWFNLNVNHTRVCHPERSEGSDVQEILRYAQDDIRGDDKANHKDVTISQIDIMTYLKNLFAAKLSISADKIDADVTYEVYGVDSLIGLEITNQLEKDFMRISKTVLYEYNTLADLAEHLKSRVCHPERSEGSDIQEILRYAQDDMSEHGDDEKAHGDDEKARGDDKVRASTAQLTRDTAMSQDIAIIGLNVVLPMAENCDEFWENLLSGKDCVEEVPKERWDYRDYPVQVNDEKKYFRYGGFIKDTDKFDPLFFNISPRDASLMDPQERLFLQSAWHTLEDAGYTRDKLRRHNHSLGVFVGATYHYYPMFLAEEWYQGNHIPLDIQFFSIANRLSYFLNAKGPSYVIDTACSSALSALHLACESLQRGDCELALAGGVSLSLHPSKYHFLGSFNFLSDKGRCESFAEGGTGYVPAEGVGALLLKPLSLALRDNDRIYAVIKASAMNHGGKTSGYTVPNPKAQQEVITLALNKANINPRTISYIEAHGTGTALGDPIEVTGLSQAFSQFTDDKQFCAIGSVKSNIGHCEAAAGISQIAKVMLQMQHQQLVASLHSEKLNPYIDFEHTPFYVQREVTSWQTEHTPRRAGVSSFGAGGTNVHVVLEEFNKNIQEHDDVNLPFIFLLSAHNHERLMEYCDAFHIYLVKNITKHNPSWLRKVCYTLQLGREHFSERLGIIATTGEELIKKLNSFILYPDKKEHDIWCSKQVNQRNNDDHNNSNEKNYSAMIEGWVSGNTIQWDSLYQNKTQQIVSLPTYPFEKRRCWITTTVKNNDETVVRGDDEKVVVGDDKVVLEEDTLSSKHDTKYQDYLYQSVWEVCDTKAQGSIKKGKWLLFSDHELGFLLQEHLGKDNCVYCFAGDNFQQVNDHVYYLDPSRPDDYHTLLQNVHERHGESLIGIIYLGTFASDHDSNHDPLKATKHLFYLLKALAEQKRQQKILFTLVTRGAQKIVPQDENIVFWHHQLWATLRIFAVEQNNIDVLLLDLDSKINLHEEAKNIISDIANYDSNQNHLAHRNEACYTHRLIRSASSVAETTTTVESALITGGLGALGFELSKWLIANGTKYLLLLGKTSLPSRDTWNTITDATLKEKVTEILELEKSGARVSYHVVDLTDKTKMQEVVTQFETEMKRRIQAVFHLAGVTTDNIPVASLSDDILDQVLNVKVMGALVLHELFIEHSLKYFVLFSSIAAVPYFGMNGLSAYATANAFLDGLALHRSAQNLHATSINWIAWAEKGMSFRHNHGRFLKAVGMNDITIQEGLACLKLILQANVATIIVSPIYWDQFLQINPTANNIDYFYHFKNEAAQIDPAPHLREDRLRGDNTIQYTYEEVEKLLIDILAASLSLTHDDISLTRPFQEFGMDSISGIQFISKISIHFPNLLKATDLYRYPTLKELIDFIFAATGSSDSSCHPRDFSCHPRAGGDPSSIDSRLRGNDSGTRKDDTNEHPHDNITREEDSDDDAIAIIGMGCRFPEAASVADYWQLLLQGKSVIGTYPESRWTWLAQSEEGKAKKQDHPYWGGYFEDITKFDAYFFGITPREALRMDPQQRLLLEVSYETFEDAGFTIDNLSRSHTGVFASLYASQFAHLQQSDDERDALFLATGNATSMAANRISYLFDLRGPSMVIDTACSSSLVALDTAIHYLQKGLCEQALVCAANINLLPSINLILSQAKMLSPVGKCKTFSADADGYVPGEGVGALLLKPLKKALADKNRIIAIIAASYSNQDGKTNGLTAPNGLQQAALLKTIYERAHINPNEVDYIECHGTGTLLGDPIELQALGDVITKNRKTDHPCLIGSVKTNLGHLEPAAGIASIIKAALILQHKHIPPHLNFDAPNPHIDFKESQFQIPLALHQLDANKTDHVVGVSGFGFGGTNAHVILVSANKTITYPHDKTMELFTLSAKSKEALFGYAQKWLKFLKDHPDLNLSQVCYHLHVTRAHYPYRLAVLSNAIATLSDALQLIITSTENLPEHIFIHSSPKTSLPKPSLRAHAFSERGNPEMKDGSPRQNASQLTRDDINELTHMAKKYVAGEKLDWQQFEANRYFAYLSLPTYAFDHKVYWPEIKKERMIEMNTHPLQGRQLSSPLDPLQFEFVLEKARLPDLADTFNVMHIGYYVELLSAIAEKLWQHKSFSLKNHDFLSPLFLLQDRVTIHVVLEKITAMEYAYVIFSEPSDAKNWIRHAKGVLCDTVEESMVCDDISVIKARLKNHEMSEALYQRIKSMAMPHGISIRWAHQYWFNRNEILVEFKQPLSTQNKNNLYTLNIHPGIFDAAVQPLFKLLSGHPSKPYIASHLKAAHFDGFPETSYYLYAVLHEESSVQDNMRGSCAILTKDNKLIAALQDVTLTQLDNNINLQEIIETNTQKINLEHISDAERQQKIIDFLSTQCASLFSMPATDIDIHQSLNSMGLDSLMALVLMRSIETSFDATLSLQDITDGASLFQIADKILYFLRRNNVVIAPAEPRKSPWIAYRKQKNEAVSRLFCFPYGGGGASIYREWQDEVSEKIEICPIQLPGRENRLQEMPLQHLDPLILSLIDDIKHELDKPYALFGHSMGALIAFEFARKLRELNLKLPEHLFVSAFPDPRVPSKSLSYLIKNLDQAGIDLFERKPNDIVHHLDDDKLSILSEMLQRHGISQYGEHLKNKEVSKTLLPIFCGDMSIVRNYTFYESGPLALPITAFVGKYDNWVHKDDIVTWKEHTRDTFLLHEIEGDHLFLRENHLRSVMLEKIMTALL